MSLSMLEQYEALLKQFVNENMSILLASRRYQDPREGREETSLDYIPEHNQTPDPGYITNTPQYSELLNTFIDTFINRDDITVKMQGHLSDIDGKTLSEILATDIRYSRANMIHEYDFKLQIDLFETFLGLRDNKPINYFVFSYGKNKVEFQSSVRCRACNEFLSMSIDYDQKAVVSVVKKPDCPLAETPRNIVVTLKSPSGKLVFLNDPREFFKLERDNRYQVSINSTLGCIQETNFYAKHNIGFFFIGNCMPSIFQKDNTILFASFHEEDDEAVEQFKEYKELGSVCADLWWYTILDYQLFLDLCDEQGVDPESIEHTVAITNKETFTVDHNLTAHEEGDFEGTFSTITY